MDDLIDRKSYITELNKRIDNAIIWRDSATNERRLMAEQAITTFCEAILTVKNMPIIEAEPVRHGKWIKYTPADFPYPYHHDDYECSVCSTLWASKEIKNMHYCPSCGAKMDEVKEE